VERRLDALVVRDFVDAVRRVLLVASMIVPVAGGASACSFVMSIDDLGRSAEGAREPSDGGLGAVVFQEDFEGFPLAVDWEESSNQGPNWYCSYRDDGSTGVEADGAGNKVLTESPEPPTAGQSQSALVRTTRSFGDLDVTLRVKTVAQLRSRAPDPTEVAQVLWHLDAEEDRCLYLLLGPAGWEIGRKGLVSDTQVVLMSGTDPFPVGRWSHPRIRQVGTKVTVWLDEGAEPRTVEDTTPAAGTIGLYVDDAHARFDDVVVRDAK